MLTEETLKQTYDARDPGLSPADDARCRELLAQWMAALNAHDATGMEAVMRFPHVRLAANTLFVYDAAGSNPMGMFKTLVDLQGWHHSAWTEITLLQSSPIKAHYAVQYARYRADGSVIGLFNSLYVFTAIEGDWKLQCRSSFGP